MYHGILNEKLVVNLVSASQSDGPRTVAGLRASGRQSAESWLERKKYAITVLE